MRKIEKQCEEWVQETQMFQRIAKVPVSSREELQRQFYEMREKK
jgi:uncharacterized protein YlbG (UPF0298 family)